MKEKYEDYQKKLREHKGNLNEDDELVDDEMQ